MRWVLKDKPTPSVVHHLQKVLGVDSEIANLLAIRGITTYEQAKAFFRPDLSNLYNPFLMKDMQKAVTRLITAFKTEETILVFGDYDVDGTTSVALMSTYLLTHTDNVCTYIPDRYKEGYGISKQAIDFAHDNDINLIIALDCGIKSVELVAYAKEKRIEFIICDHHNPGSVVPNALAVLDPKQADCNYPYKELSGCGVGFKLIQAIHQQLALPESDLWGYLDLLAISIAADIVPITDENRILTFHGLKLINKGLKEHSLRPGLKVILNGVRKSEIDITDVVFTLAPRINAAGRIKHGLYAVELLTAVDEKEVKKIADAIEEFNVERKSLDKNITQQALLQIQENDEINKFTTVVYHELWHKGVIGIVASRLIETYYRPTVVFTKSGDFLAASVRSVAGFDVYEALEKCIDYLVQFGGHKYAAGLTIRPENLSSFKEKFEEVVASSILKEQLEPHILVDLELELANFSEKSFRILKQFRPFGPGNMNPVFLSEDLRDNGLGKKIGKIMNEHEEPAHLRLQIINGAENKTYTGVGFGIGHKLSLVKDKSLFKAVYDIEENNWNGISSMQLMLKDIKSMEEVIS